MEGLAFPFYSHFPLFYLAPFHRAITERSPREERLKIATIFDQKSQFFHLFQPSLSISHVVNFSYISCKVSLHIRNAPKIAICTISVVVLLQRQRYRKKCGCANFGVKKVLRVLEVLRIFPSVWAA